MYKIVELLKRSYNTQVRSHVFILRIAEKLLSHAADAIGKKMAT